MSTEEKLRAVLNYGEKLKTRAENDILFDKIKAHINLVIIIIMILYYFRHIILEQKKIQPQVQYIPQIVNATQKEIRYIKHEPFVNKLIPY